MNTTTSTSSSNPGGTQGIVVGIASLLPTAPGDKATEKKAKKKPAAEAAAVIAPPLGGRIRVDSKLHFTNWDANKDDFVTLEEFHSGQQNRKGLESRYKRFDKDGDGKVSREEFVTPSNR